MTQKLNTIETKYHRRVIGVGKFGGVPYLKMFRAQDLPGGKARLDQLAKFQDSWQ